MSVNIQYEFNEGNFVNSIYSKNRILKIIDINNGQYFIDEPVRRVNLSDRSNPVSEVDHLEGKEIVPIPITDSSLKELNFVFDEAVQNWAWYCNGEVTLRIKKTSNDMYRALIGPDAIIGENLKFIHELQNCYLKATNKQLFQ